MLDKIPLPLWAIMLIAALLLSGIIFIFRRRGFRLKTVGVGTSGPYAEFERNSPDETAPPTIKQEVKAERDGSIEEANQNAEGTGIQQNIHSKGKIGVVKQSAKNR